MKKVREIIFYGTHFIDFYIELPKEVQEKLEYVFTVIKQVDMIPAKFLKHIEGTDGLYEIRVEYKGISYRIFCCFDKMLLVVLFNAFIKTSNKTPMNEIQIALKLKKDYFRNKIKGK
jgi:phage-related protein